MVRFRSLRCCAWLQILSATASQRSMEPSAAQCRMQRGLPIPKREDVIRSNATNAEQTVSPDEPGFFRAIHLQPSTYTVIDYGCGLSDLQVA